MTDEYIRKADAADWLKQYGQDVLHGKYKFSLMYIWKNIMDLPSADVVPVVHGKWMPQKGGGLCCSECGGYALDKPDGNFIHIAAPSKFCPYCGAKMDVR